MTPDPLTPEARQRALEWWKGCLSYLHVHDVSLPEGVIATINAALRAPALTEEERELAAAAVDQLQRYHETIARRFGHEPGYHGHKPHARRLSALAAKIRALRPEAQP